MKIKKLQVITLALSMLGSIGFAQTDTTTTPPVIEEDFFDLSLEDLLSMEVTSVSKKAERLQDVASSIYVLTAEDIKNSGATTLHEALRSVPGYWGVQDEYNSVSPTIRNSPASNGSRGTVLYLLDGTPIQDNMSSTFTFKNFDIPLDEIDRIEVIRGSGGTVYGANSATGVVNIFTKNPEKYDGISSRVEAAAPGYANVTVRAGGKINDNLSISGYGKVRSFSGYGLLNEFKGDSVWVPKSDGSGRTMIKNRFTEDFESSTMFSSGLKAAYSLNEKSKISLNTHFNTSKQTEYSNFDTDMTLLGASDSLVTNTVSRNRFVGNLRFDHNFNDKHSIFARASSNVENDFLRILGGYSVSNSIVDFEIQDNISIGSMNDLSVGINYRTVNFDVHNINDKQGIGYINPQNSETLNGAFIQDKVKLFDGKLNFLLGVKAENYSLINSNYYLSPMAKVSIMPNQNITLWGGFTQSYTTPGYNNTNIDLLLLKTLSDEVVYGMAYDGVYQNTYSTAYQEAIGGGADAATADAGAKAAADGFVASPTGQAVITGTAGGIRSSLPNNIGVINGSSTVPTKYLTWEAGIRTTMENMVSIESNFYISQISDAITASPGAISINQASPTHEGVSADYFFYGNYLKGTTYGTESMIKIIPVKGTQFEISHVYTEATWEYQENPDFDISTFTDEQKDQTPNTPNVPKHVVRMRGTFQLPKGLLFSTEMIHASMFSTSANYDYEAQRYPNIISGGGIVVAENKTRTIINLKLQKNFLNDNLNVYIFANDLFNEGIIASTSSLNNVTMSKIGAMAGLGAIYKF